MNSNFGSSYDEVPYSKKPFAQTHPNHLAVLATLFGMNPAPVDRCEVLELGCASGGNLIPMAYSLPHSHFLGIDFSARQVAEGQAAIKTLELRNIEIRQLDILEVTRQLGTFDYIIAHGVYSWVPAPVQEKVLQVCSENLAPDGIAYVSYNTYPGWHFRGMIREMMLYHTRQFPDAGAKIAQARALIEFLAKSVRQDDAYGLMLKNELNILGEYSDSYVFHEHLEEGNEPLYFWEFVERAKRHGLQYLAESDFSSMHTAGFPQSVTDTLRGITNEVIRGEQYVDFLRNRYFRQTLLCREEVTLDRDLKADNIRQLCIASAAKPVSPDCDIASPRSEIFRAPNGVQLAASDPLLKSALLCLSESWPKSLSFHDLLFAARERVAGFLPQGGEASQTAEQLLATQMLESFANGLIVLRARELPFVTKLSDRPTASACARYQAGIGDPVTNLLHESGDMPDLARQILIRLDGRFSRQDIVDQLMELIERGALGIPRQDDQPSQPDVLRKILRGAVDDNLAQFAALALLVG